MAADDLKRQPTADASHIANQVLRGKEPTRAEVEAMATCILERDHEPGRRKRMVFQQSRGS